MKRNRQKIKFKNTHQVSITDAPVEELPQLPARQVEVLLLQVRVDLSGRQGAPGKDPPVLKGQGVEAPAAAAAAAKV